MTLILFILWPWIPVEELAQGPGGGHLFVEDCVDSVDDRSADAGGSGGFALDGQRMLMLRRVGPAYVNLLLDAMEAEDLRPSIANVIETIADESHRDMIVARLADYPELIDCVHDHGYHATRSPLGATR